MRENFGIREECNGYTLIYVLIVSRGYRLSIAPFVLALVLVYCRCIVGRVLRAYRASGCFFGFLSKQNSKTPK